MTPTLRRGIVPAVLFLAGTSTVQAQTVIAHESDYAFDGVNAQYDAYDTYSSPSAVSFSPTVRIYGDPSTFVWDGSGALSAANVSTSGSTGTANLALIGAGSALNPLIGYSHYGYGASAGQGLFSTANVGGNLVLSLLNAPADFAGANTPYTLNAVFAGNWSVNGTGPLQINANSFQVASNFTITKNFVYDPIFDATFFSATAPGNIAGSFVPEPGTYALLLGMAVPFAGFAVRRRRSR